VDFCSNGEAKKKEKRKRKEKLDMDINLYLMLFFPLSLSLEQYFCIILDLYHINVTPLEFYLMKFLLLGVISDA
jgi:hypothetical protein